jgi:DNA-nicking Smr family endonuclease
VKTPDPAGGRLWAIVAATARPMPGRVASDAARALAPQRDVVSNPSARAVAPSAVRSASPEAPPSRPSRAIEPRRHHRIRRGTAPLTAFIDLHGFDQDGARLTLTRFIMRAQGEGHRTVLVITGKGALGGGVLRRRVPDWLAEPPLRGLVAGLSEAHRRHGGQGALYVALKRPRSP